MAGDLWPMFEPAIALLLSSDDDPSLWSAVVNAVYPDAQTLCQSGRGQVITRLGRCSHWFRPHQSRWTADGGFALPVGYRTGLPEFDWYAQWEWYPQLGTWATTSGDPGPDPLLLRVAVPARSRRHRQAAVHTIWQPGSPPLPRVPLVQFYGFRERGEWSCTAYRASPDERVYELVAENKEAEPLAGDDAT